MLSPVNLMLQDFVVAFGLVFVIEGLLWALFPGAAQRMIMLAASTPEGQLRQIGALAIAFGVFIVWLIKG